MEQKSLPRIEQGSVGIDVAKACLDVALLPEEAHQQFANDAAGRAALVAWELEQGPQLCVLEATGGYEAAIAADLTAAGRRVAVVNPRQVRAFAQASGQTAKTDTLDAAVLARYAQALCAGAAATAPPASRCQATRAAGVSGATPRGGGDAHR